MIKQIHIDVLNAQISVGRGALIGPIVHTKTDHHFSHALAAELRRLAATIEEEARR